jgi:hypothetical protein
MDGLFILTLYVGTNNSCLESLLEVVEVNGHSIFLYLWLRFEQLVRNMLIALFGLQNGTKSISSNFNSRHFFLCQKSKIVGFRQNHRMC